MVKNDSKNGLGKTIGQAFPPVDLYLISEKSICKNQVRQTGFLVYFELDSYCTANVDGVSAGFPCCGETL